MFWRHKQRSTHIFLSGSSTRKSPFSVPKFLICVIKKNCGSSFYIYQTYSQKIYANKFGSESVFGINWHCWCGSGRYVEGGCSLMADFYARAQTAKHRRTVVSQLHPAEPRPGVGQSSHRTRDYVMQDWA